MAKAQLIEQPTIESPPYVTLTLTREEFHDMRDLYRMILGSHFRNITGRDSIDIPDKGVTLHTVDVALRHVQPSNP